MFNVVAATYNCVDCVSCFFASLHWCLKECDSISESVYSFLLTADKAYQQDNISNNVFPLPHRCPSLHCGRFRFSASIVRAGIESCGVSSGQVRRDTRSVDGA